MLRALFPIVVFWCAMIFWMVSDLPRDSDQGLYISGALGLLQGDQSFLHADL
jgi:hypothetical protein